MAPDLAEALARAAGWLRQADGLLVTAGAGLGIDSGQPDFRGPGGFWAVYPALGKARIPFERIANPAAFNDDPRLAWGFYGHRLALYRATRPHTGFEMLRALAENKPHGIAVFTSNVDGHFQKAGFPAQQVCETHGSIHHLQCTAGCGEQIWSADAFQPEVDAEHCRLFGDGGWVERRSMLQYQRLQHWLNGVDRLVCIEIGAGTHIPTVRHFSENAGGKLIRINPGEAEISRPDAQIGLPLGGLAGINQLFQACQQA